MPAPATEAVALMRMNARLSMDAVLPRLAALSESNVRQMRVWRLENSCPQLLSGIGSVGRRRSFTSAMRHAFSSIGATRLPQQFISYITALWLHIEVLFAVSRSYAYSAVRGISADHTQKETVDAESSDFRCQHRWTDVGLLAFKRWL